MALKQLCTPALIFIIYAFTQIIMDTSYGLLQTALTKFFISIVITTLLQYLCLQGMKVISWVFVFVPLFLMTTITSIILFGSREEENLYENTTNMDIREKYKFENAKFENAKPMDELFSNDDSGSGSDYDSKYSDDVIDSSKNSIDSKPSVHSVKYNDSTIEPKKPDIQNNSVSKDNDCKYANFPECIDQPEKLITNDYETTTNSTEKNNKDENNTRILSFLLIRAFKNYVAKIPEKDTTESIVQLIHD